MARNCKREKSSVEMGDSEMAKTEELIYSKENEDLWNKDLSEEGHVAKENNNKLVQI